MKNKHITDAQRLIIEHSLRDGMSFNEIGDKIGKHRSTISREVIARRTPSSKGAFGRVTNRCVHKVSCYRRQLCMKKPDCTRRCSFCSLCNRICPDYVEQVCEKLSQPPYVCNGCAQEKKCVLRKQYYLHNPAHQNYRKILEESRSGANITEGELISLNNLFSPLIRNGQSVHHIMTNNPDRFTLNEKTVYRYVADGLLSVKNGDMPRICMIRPRRKKPIEHKVDRKCRIGRSFDDFNAFLDDNPEVAVTEMDSVIGRVGGKVLLTLMLRSCGFMFAFIRDSNNSQSVIDIFESIWQTAGEELFTKLFEVLLTDNGSEFSNPGALELAPSGGRRTHVFYCNPYASYQKPRVERNHELLRLILPKRTSFDHLTQKDINTALSHINSYSRPVLNDKSPYDLFEYLYGAEFLTALGIEKIAPNDIILKPGLLPTP